MWRAAPVNLLQQAKQFHRARAAWLGDGGRSPNAQQRANICLTCPHNKAGRWEEWFKGAAAHTVRLQLELKGRMRLHVEGEEGLHMCNLCGCILSLKVHMPLGLARANTPDWQRFIGTCWLHRDDLP